MRGAARQSPDGTVYGVDLPSYVEPAKSNAALVHATNDKQQKNRETSLEGRHEPHDHGEVKGLDERVRRFTRHVVHDALTDCGGSRRRAAEQLRITRQRLYKHSQHPTDVYESHAAGNYSRAD